MEQLPENQIKVLKKKATTFKIIFAFFTSIIFMMMIVAFLLYQKEGITITTFFPVFLIFIDVFILIQLKKIKKQLIALK